MDEEIPSSESSRQVQDIVQRLLGLRDALTELAMLLREFQFENDAVTFEKAVDEASRVLENISISAKDSYNSEGPSRRPH